MAKRATSALSIVSVARRLLVAAAVAGLVPLPAQAQRNVVPQPPAALMPDGPRTEPPLPPARSGVDDPARASAAAARVRRLLNEGKTDQARALLDQAIADAPRDAQLRFLNGVMLADAGKTAEAIAVFEQMTRDFPELAEPYNNLAVMHAANGDLDKARVALEKAVAALPGYALGHENLGDVYVRMALRSYERAAELAPKRESIRQRLTLARDFIQRVAPATANKP